MRYFVYYYLYDERIKNVLGGPIKVFDLCSNLVKMGHEVVLFSPDCGFPEKQTTARVIKIPALGVPILGILWHEALLLLASLLELRNGRCSAVYVRTTTSFVPLLIKKLTGAVLLTEVNDDPFFRYASTSGAMKLKLPLVRLCDRVNLKSSDAIFPVNFHIKTALANNLGISADRMVVIPSGANTDLFKPYDRKQACAELSLEFGLRYVCFVGSLNSWNDYGLLVTSAKVVCRTGPDIRYLMLGDLGEAQAVIISESGLAERFILRGRVAPLEAAKHIACAAVCLSAITPATEAMMPVKIFDYLACARPVVAAMPPGVENIFEGCGAVAVTPSGDIQAFTAATLRFLSDPDLAARLGAEGRDYIVKHYDRSAVAEQIVSITKKLL